MRADLDIFSSITEGGCMEATFRSRVLQYPEAEPDSKNTRVARCITENKFSDFWQGLTKEWEKSDLAEDIVKLLRETFALYSSILNKQTAKPRRG